MVGLQRRQLELCEDLFQLLGRGSVSLVVFSLMPACLALFLLDAPRFYPLPLPFRLALLGFFLPPLSFGGHVLGWVVVETITYPVKVFIFAKKPCKRS